MTKLARYLLATALLAVAGTVALTAAAPRRSVREPQFRLVEAVPAAGTFFSLQLDLPPYPFNPFPGYDLYAFTTAPDTFYVDDLAVDYTRLKSLPGLGVAYDVAVPDGLTAAAAVAQLSASSGGRRFLALMSVPPPPPGNGGGGSTNPTNVVMLAYNYSTNDLWLEIIGRTNTTGYFRIHSPVANGVYDVFSTTNLRVDVPGLNFTNWMYRLRTSAGQTDVTVTGVTDPINFFKLGTMLDTDGEGLTDAYEHLVSHTNPNLWDTDGDGLSDYYEVVNGLDPWDPSDNKDDDHDGLTKAFEIVASHTNPGLWDTDSDGLSDGEELNPSSGIPWILEQAKATNVILYANVPTATEGGANGQFTLRLPSPAPSGGKKVEFIIVGSAEPGSDYTLSVATNALTIAQGASTGTITVTAVNDTAPSTGNRTVELLLTNAPGLVVFSRPAVVQLVDDDPQQVRVFASSAEGTEGTNALVFTLVREGVNTAALTVNLGWGGPATRGTDYSSASAPTTMTFPAGVGIVPISFVPTLDSVEEGEESVTLTVGTGTGYAVDASASTATAWINEAPLPTVSISVIDADAREQGPKQAVLKVSRTGTSRSPLEVHLEDRRPYGARDYTCLSSNSVFDLTAIIPAGTNEVRVYFTPQDDPFPEIRTVVPIALGGGTDYRINPNAYVAEVWVEDNEAATYSWSQDKATAAYTASPLVDSPVTLTFFRTGSTASQADYAHALSSVTGSYAIDGDVSGSYVRFLAGSSTARVYVHARSSSGGLSFGCPQFMQGGAAQLFFLGGDKLVFAKVTSTNDLIAVEGGSKKAKVQVTRAVASSSPTTVYFDLAGSSTLGSDYTLASTSLTKTSDTSWVIPANSSGGDIEITATTDALAEGWETLVFQLQTNNNNFTVVPTSGARATVLLRDLSTTNAMPFVDSDGDSLSDFYELAYGLDPSIAQPSWLDSDGDGLSDRAEQGYGFNPKAQKTNPSGPGDFLAAKYAAAGVSTAAQFALAFPLDSGLIDLDPTGIATGPVTLLVTPRVLSGFESPGNEGRWTAEGLERGRTYELRLVPNPGTPANATYSWALGTYSYPVAASEYLETDGETGDGFVLSDPQAIFGYNRTVGTGLSNKVAQLHVANPRLFVDLDRDGAISTNRTDTTDLQHPFRFWTNTDDDSGETGGSDYEEAIVPDAANTTIDGERDLVDFFPMRLDLEELLKYATPAKGYQYRLRHPDAAVNIAYTSLSRTNAYDHLSKTNAAWPLAYTNTYQVTSGGILLATNWLAGITNGRGGILLVEGRYPTTNALVLEVFRYQTQRVASAELHLSLSKVERMYRHKNLTYAANLAEDKAVLQGGRRDDLAEPPNWPDALGTNRNFLHLHGYNVNPQQARGWHSEAFKRLWWSGSRARFYGVTWRGAEGQLLGSTTPNYQLNVVHAFETAPELKAFLVTLSGASTVSGHSLGNMVVSAAISDHGAAFARYLMIDAAVAQEAYDAGETENANMIHPDWLPYTNRLRASEWFKLFPAGDGRRALTWRGRFSNFGAVQYFNYYSSGEEVLAMHTSTSGPTLLDALHQDGNLFSGWGTGRYAWALQEKLKGRLPLGIVLSSRYGGWGRNDTWGNLVPAQAAYLGDAQLMTAPFFDPRHFSDNVFGAAIPMTLPVADRNRYLAQAFPATTLPAGANSVNAVNVPGQPPRNFDMHATMKSGWPRVRLADDNDFEWKHSDYRNVAYLYTWPLFTNFVFNGNLK